MTKALILAAGCARRLRPLTDECPKCLLEVKGKPLLGHTLDACIKAGLTDICIVNGYLNRMIKNYVRKYYARLRVTFIDNPLYESTNNIYSLYLARDFFQGEDVMLMDSDIMFSPDILTRLISEKTTCLAVNSHDLGEEEIKVITDTRGMVEEISKTCSIDLAMGESVGIECMHSDYTRALSSELEKMVNEEGLDNVFYELAFERLIPQGYMFKAVSTTDLFSMEIDTVEDYELIKN